MTGCPRAMVALGFAVLLSSLQHHSLTEPSRDAVTNSSLSGLQATPQMMRACALIRCWRVKGTEPACAMWRHQILEKKNPKETHKMTIPQKQLASFNVATAAWIGSMAILSQSLLKSVRSACVGLFFLNCTSCGFICLCSALYACNHSCTLPWGQHTGTALMMLLATKTRTHSLPVELTYNMLTAQHANACPDGIQQMPPAAGLQASTAPWSLPKTLAPDTFSITSHNTGHTTNKRHGTCSSAAHLSLSGTQPQSCPG